MEHLLWHRIRMTLPVVWDLHSIPPLPKNIQPYLPWEESLTTTLVGVCHLYTIALIIQSPLPYHSCSSQNFFFQMKIDLSWERSGIYNLSVGCSVLTNFSYWKVSLLFFALLWTACMFGGRKGTSSRANNSILGELWTALWKHCLRSHWKRGLDYRGIPRF